MSYEMYKQQYDNRRLTAGTYDNNIIRYGNDGNFNG